MQVSANISNQPDTRVYLRTTTCHRISVDMHNQPKRNWNTRTNRLRISSIPNEWQMVCDVVTQPDILSYDGNQQQLNDESVFHLSSLEQRAAHTKRPN